MTAVLPAAPPLAMGPPSNAHRSAGERLRQFGRPPRIVGLDIARGVAVIGMIAVHTLSLPGELVWNDPTTWSEIASGRSSILFALLAGVSIALTTGRTRVPFGPELGRVRAQLFVRGLVIFLIGLVLELLGTNIAVILTFYGAVYAVSTLFVGMRVRSLIIWAAAVALAGPPLLAGLTAILPYGSGAGAAFVLEGTYSIVVWSALMLAGLALGRLDLTRRRVAARILVAGLVLSIVGVAVSALWEVTGGASDDSSFDGSSSSSSWSDSWDDSMTEAVPGEDVDLSGLLCEDYGDGYVSCYPEEDAVGSDDPYTDDDGDGCSGDGSYLEGEGWAAFFEQVCVEGVAASMAEGFFDHWAHTGGTMELLDSGGFAMALIGFLLLVGRFLRYVLMPIAAIGAMPLTAYSIHVIAILVVLGPAGWSEDSPLFTWLVGGLAVGCTAWAILVGRGPLERFTAWAVKRLVPGPGGTA